MAPAGAVIIAPIPIEANTASKAAVNFPVADQVGEPVTGIVQVDGEATGQLDSPVGGGELDDTQQVCPAGVVFDDEGD